MSTPSTGSALHTASAARSAELAVVTRTLTHGPAADSDPVDVVESRHVGSAVVIGPGGGIRTALGDPSAMIFPRSTLKPLQAVASLRAGALISPEAVALACGSHTGSARHQKLAAQVLSREGLDASDLKCPAAFPSRTTDLREHLGSGQEKTALAFNCSGKHAAFLAAARTQGSRLATYTDPSHPLQQEVSAVYEEYCGETPLGGGVDGCGAPAALMSLIGLARGIGRLASSLRRREAEVHAFTVAQAMLDFPWAVSGDGEPDTVVIEELGLISKLGAEGVLVVAAADGTAAAVKTLDGSHRANHLVALSLLAAQGAVDIDDLARVLPRIIRPITGGAEGTEVGSIRLSPQVTAQL